MRKRDLSNSLLNNSKERTVETEDILVRGNLLKWEGVMIQISNISLITTADMNTPPFPIWAAIVTFIGFFLLSEVIWVPALLLTLVGFFVIYKWYKKCEIAKKHKYLNILLNSGYTYSILFYNSPFLEQVFSVISNILEEGVSSGTNYHIDISNCTIADNSSVVNTTK